jgi:predicted O-methyltransferase YrrM
VACTLAVSAKVKKLKLIINPRTIPKGRKRPFKVPPDSRAGKTGRIQSVKTVKIPARNEKINKIDIKSSFHHNFNPFRDFFSQEFRWDRGMATSSNHEIKEYICKKFVKESGLVALAKSRSKEAHLPDIAVPENVGKLLSILALLKKPKRILEIGTLAGYSTLWMAQSVPDAEIVTLEYDPNHSAIAKKNFQDCGVSSQIKLIEGDAAITLQSMIQQNEEPFDLIFLDADKERYPLYLPLLLALSKEGTLLLTDNLIPKNGPINQPPPGDGIAAGTYHYNDLIASHPNLETILINTIVGISGRIDALGVSIVKK